MKDKKITIKPFINKNLSPLEGTQNFPLYFQITYERRNTQVKSYFNSFFESVENLRGEELDLLKFEIEILERTVAFEKNKIGNSFTLHGIKDKYDIYILSLETVFEGYLKKKLLKAIRYCNSEFLPIIKFEGFEVTFSLLYKASKLLIDNFTKTLPIEFKEEIEAYHNFMLVRKNKPKQSEYECIMDWLDNEYRIELRNQFFEFFNEKSTQTEKTISILDSIVEDRLKFL